MAYCHFRHFGKDKVTMDFAFFTTAFNIKKMYPKIAKQSKYPILTNYKKKGYAVNINYDTASLLEC
ncbi:MAG: hypothetical protein K2K26_02795 [Muribaculaceae bacterium]|nr:hypothetical protein [Muribaculaceae bacterium]